MGDLVVRTNGPWNSARILKRPARILKDAEHLPPGKPLTEEIARATRLIEGSDDGVKSRAHTRLMLLTRH